MRRVLKISLAVLGIVVALLVAVAIALPLLVDPNDYRDEIEAAVEENTGREFVIDGDLRLTVFPWLGVEVGPARLANAPGFGDQPFAEIKAAQVSVRVLPLLHRRIEVGTVGLDGLRLRLATQADGTSNWDDLVEALADEQAPAEPEPEREEGGWTVPELEIGAIEITDAAVSYRDGASGHIYLLHDADLTTGRLAMGRTFPITMRFAFEAEDLGLAGRTHLVAQVQPDLESQFHRFSELSLNVHAAGESVPGEEQQIRLTGRGEIDMQTGRLNVSDLVVQGFGAKVTGNIDGNDLTGEPAFNGRLSVERLNPREVMRQLGVELPATSDSDVLSSASLDVQIRTDLESAELKQLLVKVDESTLEGNARIDGIGGPAGPTVAFELALDRINLDRYLPPEGGPEDEEDESEPPAEDVEISLQALENLRLDGRMTVGSLTVANLDIEDTELVVTARDGVLTIRPLSAGLYDGSLEIDSRIDASGDRPGYAVRGNLEGLQLGPLLADLIGQEKVSALGNLQIDLTASGNTVDEIKRALDGSVAFELRDGAFHGFDLSNILTMARNRLVGESARDGGADTGGETPFSRFAASFTVNDGVFRGGDLNLVTPVARLAGDGSFNLVDNQLDYTVTAHIPEDAEGDVLKELAGYSVPIRLSGDLFSPDYSVDLKSVLEGAARRRLREEESEIREKLDERVQEEREELQDRFRKGLRDLLN